MSRQNGRKKRESEVYTTAARLFATKGFHATRMQDIADELGMQKGSLYYYFDSKEHLLNELVSGAFQEALTAVHAILATNHTPAQKLALAIDEHLRFLRHNVDIHLINVREILTAVDPATAVTIATLMDDYEAAWVAILHEGIQRGEFRADLDAPVTVKALVGLCNSTMSWFDENGRLPGREIARIFAELVTNGLQKRVL